MTSDTAMNGALETHHLRRASDKATETEQPTHPRVAGTSSLPIRSLLDLSTAHLREETCIALGSYEDVVAYPTTHGWLMYASEEADFTEGDDWPPELLPIVELARANGCTYVLFDADAPETDALPTFDTK
ncbi:hypothetical protein ACIO3O_37995 [Streptomyces sp. NPDC087440]|uniref:DUF5983 family protein n=1 Tax=Streptomyces sp. NPDC087440 TaxID=3365790 RepID=UPI0037F3F3D6